MIAEKRKKNKIIALLLAMTMVLTMMPAVAFAGVNDAEGEPSSYGYVESPAESVKVYVTISDDGMPLKANDEEKTVTAHMEVNVPYFDLKEYGLENYYRYETKGGSGSYINQELIERPTALHLFIYLAERYYLGLDENDCGVAKEVSRVFEYAEETELFYLDGTSAYTGTMKAFAPGGSPTSFYISGGFWGHDENLNYYRNHRYPLMGKAWGATADYMLLSDGDIIEVAMNTDWNKISSGDNLCFNKDDYEGDAGSDLTITTMSAKRSAWGDGETPILTFTEELNVALYDANWKKTDAKVICNGEGSYTVTLPEKAGQYYLLGTGLTAKTADCVDAPATAKVVVKEAATQPAPEPEKPAAPVVTPTTPEETVKTESEATVTKKVSVAKVTGVKAKAGKKKVTVSWKKVKGADGYKIYRYDSKSKKYKAVKTIKKGKTVKWTNKKLKKGKTYKYKVKAYKKVNGKTYYSKSYSKVVKAKAK